MNLIHPVSDVNEYQFLEYTLRWFIEIKLDKKAEEKID